MANKDKIKSVVIVGAGGCGKVTLEVVKNQNRASPIWNIMGFIDDNEELHGKEINGYPVLGGLDWLRQYSNDNLGCVVAIDSCEIRKQVVARLHGISINFYNAIDPLAIIEDFVEIGNDVVIQSQATLRVNSRIGDHVHISTTALIGHEAIIGNYCTIAPRGDIDGKVRLDEGVYVGSHAVLLPGVSIGSWSTIGAGAVVTKDIPKNAVAVGMPAKVIKRKTPL
ncbi:putative acetyltransferase EpsM [subsurface metagenome]